MKDNAEEAEQLLNDLESIYLQDGWRKNKELSKKVDEIKKRLGDIL